MNNFAKLAELKALELEALDSLVCKFQSALAGDRDLVDLNHTILKETVAKIRALVSQDEGEWEYAESVSYKGYEACPQGDGWILHKVMTDGRMVPLYLWRRRVKKETDNPVAKARNALFDVIARAESLGLETDPCVKQAYELLDKLVALKDRCD